jgi:hypothetical protein
MGDDIDSNAVAAAARLEHLIPAYQQDHPTSVLRADIAHLQSGGQFSESDKAGSENTDSDEDLNDFCYGQVETEWKIRLMMMKRTTQDGLTASNEKS